MSPPKFSGGFALNNPPSPTTNQGLSLLQNSRATLPNMKRLLTLALCLVMLSGCSGQNTSEEKSTIKAIGELLRGFQVRHPDLVNWDKKAVMAELDLPLPLGVATEAGLKFMWPHPDVGQLPQIILPWSKISQKAPQRIESDARYSGGTATVELSAAQIRQRVIDQDLQGDATLAAVTDLRTSRTNPDWVIFTVVPYLPFTDSAYGFAHLRNGRWEVADFGTATVGCGIVPEPVQTEFGFTCPPGS